MSSSSQRHLGFRGALALAAVALLAAALGVVTNMKDGAQHAVERNYNTASTAISAQTHRGVTAAAPPLDPAYAAQIAAMRSDKVPDLPFGDNPDPSQCGIPVAWGEDSQAWLTGIYEGKLAQPTVFLYDSHLRLNIIAKSPHGTEVDVILYQKNPVTDYYFVKIKGAEQPNEGWVPGPFLSFDPVSATGSSNQP